jgi:predicted nucleic acid-binding protein
MESSACEQIFDAVEDGTLQLVWSFIHQDENSVCPFPDRKLEVIRLSGLCEVRVDPSEKIRNIASQLTRKAGISAKDALHVACATHSGSQYFLTCDDQLLKKRDKLKLDFLMMNPVEYTLRLRAEDEN